MSGTTTLGGGGGGGRDSGAAAAVASVGEVTREPYAGPRWDVAVACGGLKGMQVTSSHLK